VGVPYTRAVRFAGIVVAGLLGGCSIIFNSGDLPVIADAAVDASPDARPPADATVFDVNPNGLTLATVTPAAILEKLIEYEAVHQIQGFPDLKRRLERDRRCFAFFHPALKDEPLIFVEVAFVNDLPADVAPILALESAVGDPRRARCAVFYSITSCQPGLRGISFGNFLIKQVAQDLHAELPNLKIFATLSPIPGLRAWTAKRTGTSPQGPAVIEASREKLESLAAWYLTREWSSGHVLDPVARFHLGNGARLERLNWMADASDRGLAQSFGLMVNYVYDLGDVERNHEEYVKRHRVVCSGAVEKRAEAAAAWIESASAVPTSNP